MTVRRFRRRFLLTPTCGCASGLTTVGDGSQLLIPDQRLAASGYALMAGGVDLPATTSASTGVLILGGNPFLHAYGRQNNLLWARAPATSR